MLDREKHNVLYVDDRLENLHAFKGSLRRDYNVFVTLSCLDAFNLLKENDFAVVVADFKMSQMTGVEFLEEIRKLSPQTIRILTSGHADINALILSVNKGEVFRFIQKPWSEHILNEELYNSIQEYKSRVRKMGLEKSISDLAQFGSNTILQLNGPIATLDGLIQLSISDPLNAMEYLGYMRSTIKALRVSIKNIASYNNYRYGPSKLEHISLGKVVNEVVEAMKSKHEFGGADLEVIVKDESHALASIELLKVCLENLLLNAIKFTDSKKHKHKITVTTQILDGYPSVCIEDNGIGIETSNLDKARRIFFRESTGTAGEGLGLFVVSELAKQMRAQFELESEKWKYTKATLKLSKE